ncbi:hypothetical protein R2F61_04100 [Mollicutes bacterium LVI A0078]|nr:hypothetical protein RZE84_04120 [Mollicutes bacterium LVI A0075]WOO91744.1 hypothetical protein R2F61_04100 [Mollicutes bacterium LVI A0078]
MNKVTIKTKDKRHELKLDFNRTIIDVLAKIDVELGSEQMIVALLYKRVVNPSLSFNQNGIANNEILEIKERYEIEL